MSILFNAADNMVELWCGLDLLDRMSLQDYQALFGLPAKRQLVRGYP